MLRPEVIEKIQKKEEAEKRPSLELPLYPPMIQPSYRDPREEPEETTARVVIIDL